MIPAPNPELERLGRGEFVVCPPPDVTDENLIVFIQSIGKSVATTERRSRAERYALGRAMAMAANRPTFLKTAGFDTFSDYEDALIKKTGLERSTLWSWKPIAERLPGLNQDQLAKISRESLNLIARHVPESKRDGMLTAAAEMTFQKFKAHAEMQGLEVGGGASIIISGDKKQIAELRRYLEKPEVVAFTGTPNLCEILLCMIAEVQGSNGWPAL